jgi:hypothetical protein
MAAPEQEQDAQQRERRRAAALRENLGRRKAQQRARTEPPEAPEPAGKAPQEDREP